MKGEAMGSDAPMWLAQTTPGMEWMKWAGPAFVAMATAISVLWTRHVAAHKESIRRAEAYEAKNDVTTEKQIKMAEQIGELKGRQDGIEMLSKKVLEVVENAVSKNNEDS